MTVNWNTCKVCGKYLIRGLSICPVCRIKSSSGAVKESTPKKRGRPKKNG